jgi:pimeloyl-ACP methyl ester carboxylesterase
MSTFVLVPGAGGAASYWYRVVPLLEAAGHDVIAVELPGADASKHLDDYAGVVLGAIGSRTNAILVAQSLGGFTAGLVCQRTTLKALIFINAMIPLPGETAGAWWGNTGSTKARVDAAREAGYSTDFDLQTYFLHDVPPAVAEVSARDARPQSEAMFGDPCRFEEWPAIPIRVIAGSEDRFFPIGFQKRVAHERLNRDVEEVRGGHLVALSNPEELVKRLLAGSG